MTRRLALVSLLAIATAGLAACSTTIDGTGTRVGAGSPSATDFPSPTTSDQSSSPTDSSSPTSSSGGDGSDLVDQMVDAMTSREQGFTVKGKSDSDGDVLQLDLRMARTDGKGTITIGDDVCQLVNVDGTGYALAPAAFWKDDLDLSASVAAAVDKKWVELTGQAKALTTFVDAKSFFELAVQSSDDYTLGDTTTKQGIDVQAVKTGSDTLYIAADEPHLLVEVDGSDGQASAFSFPDDDLAVSAPAGAIPFPG